MAFVVADVEKGVFVHPGVNSGSSFLVPSLHHRLGRAVLASHLAAIHLK
jgi:hypothetical protein